MYQTNKKYKKKIKTWKIIKLNTKITPKGNTILQIFYAKEVLFKYIKKIKVLKKYFYYYFHLQKDSNFLHNNKSINNLCIYFKCDVNL